MLQASSIAPFVVSISSSSVSKQDTKSYTRVLFHRRTEDEVRDAKRVNGSI